MLVKKIPSTIIKMGIRNILILPIVNGSRQNMRSKGNKIQGLEIRIQVFLPPRSRFREALVEELKVKGSLPESGHEQMGFRILMKERRITWKTKLNQFKENKWAEIKGNIRFNRKESKPQKYIGGLDVLWKNICKMDDQIKFSNVIGGDGKQVTKKN